MPDFSHKIIHVDMDAFFASVEQRDHPEYRGKPLAVGGNKLRGVVAAASYEARKFGVRSAMPSRLAAKLCPHLIFARGRFEAYKEASDIIMKIFREYTDLVEPMSLDEAYLDVTQNKKNIPSALWIGNEIRQKIKDRTELTASAGVSFNKFLAKVASDFNKPDGICLIKPEDADDFIDKLPIKKIPGIGKVTEEKMHNLSIFTGYDLKNVSKFFLANNFGKVGTYYYDLLRHEHYSEVTPHRERKSIGAERTFEEDIASVDTMLESLQSIVSKLYKRLKDKEIFGKTVTLKIKYHDFELNTRSRTMDFPVQSETELQNIASELLLVPIKPIKPVRLLGVQLSNLNTKPGNNFALQLTFDFYNESDDAMDIEFVEE
jgi:DNA polymerase IV